MPITIDALRNAAYRSRAVTARTLTEARTQGFQTVFLCHSHHDELLVKGVIALLQESGWKVYVDWADASMPATPTRETAARIKQKIVDLNFFLFLATSNSMTSRWCPWEIGYADGKKQIDKILIFPTIDGSEIHGNEYLQTYRRIDMSTAGKMGVWQPDKSDGVLIQDL